MIKLFKKPLLLLVLVIICLSLFETLTFAASSGRYLLDAETLSDDTIAVLFIKGSSYSSGPLYYGIYDPTDNSWEEEMVAEVAKGGALAIYNDAPYVAYTTSDNLIGYTYKNGDVWSEVNLIYSANANGSDVNDSLSSPDISVDSNGIAHIAYIDSDGAGDDDYHKADVMCANRIALGFSIDVICSNTGYGDSWGRRYDELVTPVKYDIGDNDYLFVFNIHTYDWASGSGAYNEYNYKFVTSGDSKKLRTNSGGKVYEVVCDGTNCYSLLSQDGKYFVNNKDVKIDATEKATSIVAADMTLNNSKIYYAAINGSNLLFYQDGTFIEDITSSTALLNNHKKLATVISGGDQYILYTGADSDNSLVISRLSDGVLNEYLIPNEYKVTVTNGSAMISDVAVEKANVNDVITLVADEPAEGKEFDKWVADQVSVVFDDEESATTTFTMPAEDVTITATFKDIIPEGYLTSPTITEQELDYDELDYKYVKVSLIKNYSLDPARLSAELSGTNANCFEYDLKNEYGVLVGTGNWTNILYIRPITGLGLGEYEAKITLRYDADEDDVYETTIGSCNVSFKVTSDVLIPLANCTLKKPIAGGYRDTNPISSDPEKYRVEFANVYLTEYPYPNVEDGETFELDKEYEYRIRFEAMPGYRFAYGETEYTINGDSTSSYGGYVSNWRQVSYVAKVAHTVTFDTKGGSEVESQLVRDGDTLERPIDPTLSTWSFMNWYLNPNENTRYDDYFPFGTPITEDITLEAMWGGNVTVNTENTSMGKLAIDHSSEGLEYDEHEYLSMSTFRTYNNRVTIGAKANPGYRFVKWTLDGVDYSTDEEVSFTADNGDMIFTAVFIKNPGDLNSDEAINIIDVRLLLQKVISSVENTPENLATCDINNDGLINIIDVRLLLQKVITGP